MFLGSPYEASLSFLRRSSTCPGYHSCTIMVSAILIIKKELTYVSRAAFPLGYYISQNISVSFIYKKAFHAQINLQNATYYISPLGLSILKS